MIDLFLAAFDEWKSLEKEFSNGLVEECVVLDSKKRLAKFIDDYIDYRIKLMLEVRRKEISKEKIDVANALNSSVKSTSQTIKTMTALNLAPVPPDDTTDKDAVAKWFKQYKSWYEKERKRGVSIE